REGIDAAVAALERAPPLEILAWIAARCPGRVAFATGFGAEGCVLIDLIGRHDLPIEIFTLDTGYLFPETHDLWRRLEQHYGLSIRRVRPGLKLEQGGQATQGKAPLWQTDPDRCCELLKIDPLRGALGKLDAWVTAIRREQTAVRRQANVVEWDANFGLLKVNPLAAWTHAQVWERIREHEVPYNPLYTRQFASIGCWPCSSVVGPGESAREGRWRGRAKTECGLHQPARADGSSVRRVRDAQAPAIRDA
ncbi:MAG: phosphoadenylyl-sulfate reductase, partial [Vicinamibacterales bacterium]|nr:phosphoadenylyl-sulfate reductase [Vicinamibacterales bacterium]